MNCLSTCGMQILTERPLQADWEDTNRKSSVFAVIQEDDDAEENNGDDVMTVNTEQPKSTVNALASTNVVSNPVAADPAPVDKDDEIT